MAKSNNPKEGEQGEKEGTPESENPFFEQLDKQMKLWEEFIESEEGMEASRAGLDFARISSRHIAEMFTRIGEILPETMSPDETFQASKDIYLVCARSYSEMFKEAMSSPSILKQNAKTLDAFLDWKIQIDKLNRETLRGQGIPSSEDIDELSERLYWLDRKLDDISKEMKGTDSRQRRHR